jgi:hypothetical protein
MNDANLLAVARLLLLDRAAGAAIAHLEAAGIPSILLKGPSIASWLYDAGDIREYGDVDLLVAPSMLEGAKEALAGLGYVHQPSGVAPSQFYLPEQELFGPSDVCIDLHYGLIGVLAPPERAWDVLSEHAVLFDLGAGYKGRVLDFPGRAMHLALHAAQNGPVDTKAIADLERALGAVEFECWRQAAELADRLGADRAFAAGLRLVPAGRLLADELSLTRGLTVELALRSRSAPQDAIFFERLSDASGVRGKTAVLAQKIFPGTVFLRRLPAVSSSNAVNLLWAELCHVRSLATRFGPALAAWRRARVEARSSESCLTGPTVLYIAGFGRSGSTLLERILGQVPGFVDVGELVFLWDRALTRDELCGCGTPFSACPYWTAVGERAFGGWDRVDVARALELKNSVDRNRHLMALLAPRCVPGFAAGLDEYLSEYIGPVYAAAAAVAGADVVIDSSKHSSTAFMLRHLRGVNLRVAHLVRHPQGVAYSWTKKVCRPEADGPDAWMPQYSAAASTAWWLFLNTSLRALSRLGVSTEVVRYEDLAHDPRGVARRLVALSGQPTDDQSFAFIEGQHVHLRLSHGVAGNPMRFREGRVEVQPDDAWRLQPRRRDRLVVTAIAAACPTPTVRYAISDLRGHRSRPVTVAAPETPSIWPSVTAVVATRDRPALLQRAVDSIVAQDYPGELQVVVVYDQCPVDRRIAGRRLDRDIRALANARRSGLAGARNTGVSAAEGDLVAFCDDDDEWLPVRLREQVELLNANPWASVVSSGIVVNHGGTISRRRPPRQSATYEDLLRSRLSWIHSSTLLVRREDFLSRIGWVDEELPSGYGEDYEWLLRAARVSPILVAESCLVRINWQSQSYFDSDWQTKITALRWLLDRHPDLAAVPKGHARILGQIAFAEAALGRRGKATRTACRALAANPVEVRAVIAMGVAAGVLNADRVTDALHRRGRGV